MAIGCSEPVGEIVSTSNAASYNFGSFTPGTDRILVVLAIVRGSVAAGSMTTVSGTSLTWTQKTSGTFNSGADTMYCYWARTPSSTAPSVYSVSVSGDNGTGCMAYMFEFTGGDMTSSDPIAQAKTSSGSSTNPTITLDAAMNTANGYCAAWMGALSSSNPADVSTAPSSWTEIGDNGFGSPTSNASGAYRAGSETGTTVTFTANSTTWGLIFAEVKIVAQSLAPTIVGTTADVVNPTMSPGAASLAPTVTGLTAGVVNPTLSPGAVTITPSAASVTAGSEDPTIAVAGTSQDLQPTVTGVAADMDSPSLTAGAATLTPTVTDATAGTVDPSLIAGAASLGPDVVGVDAGVVSPSLEAGAVSIAPTVASAQSDCLSVELSPGSVQLIPQDASVGSSAENASLLPGAATMTPTVVEATSDTEPVSLTSAGATLIPQVAGVASDVESPTLSPGAADFSPVALGAAAGTVDPEIATATLGQTLTPTAAIVVSVALTPPPGPSWVSNWTLRIDIPHYGVSGSLIPDGDGGLSDCTVVGAASNWLAEQDGADGSYCWSGFPGDADAFTVTNLRNDALLVISVSLWYRVSTTGSSGTQQFRALAYVGASVYRSAPIDVDYDWNPYTLSDIPCPDGGDWTVAKVNSMRIGYEVEFAQGASRIQFADCRVDVVYAVASDAIPVPGLTLPLTRAAAAAGKLRRVYEAHPLATARVGAGSARLRREYGVEVEVDRASALTHSLN